MAADRPRKDPGQFLWVSLTSWCFRKVVEVEAAGRGECYTGRIYAVVSVRSRVHDPPSLLNKQVFV